MDFNDLSNETKLLNNWEHGCPHPLSLRWQTKFMR